MVKKQKTEKTEKNLLVEINNKMDLLILILSLQDKEMKDQIKILKNYNGDLSKRELERITGIDRHLF